MRQPGRRLTPKRGDPRMGECSRPDAVFPKREAFPEWENAHDPTPFFPKKRRSPNGRMLTTRRRFSQKRGVPRMGECSRPDAVFPKKEALSLRLAPHDPPPALPTTPRL